MMQTPSRTTDIKSKKESNDEASKKQDEKLKKSINSISTPRDFIQKSTTADIYAQKKKTSQNMTKAPKKVRGVTNASNVKPMKGFSQASRIQSLNKIDAKNLASTRKNETPKKPFTNVTVNSPAVKRRLVLNSVREKEAGSARNNERKESLKSKEVGKLSRQVSNVSRTKEDRIESKEAVKERQRTKTRTLEENEVKILTPDVLDNNAGMINLSQKLKAQPKAFYVDLDKDKPTVKVCR